MTVIRTSVLVESTFLPEMKGDKQQTLTLPTLQYLRKPYCTKVAFSSLTAACLPYLSGSCSRWLRLPCVCRPNHLEAFVFVIVSRSTVRVQHGVPHGGGVGLESNVGVSPHCMAGWRPSVSGPILFKVGLVTVGPDMAS